MWLSLVSTEDVGSSANDMTKTQNTGKTEFNERKSAHTRNEEERQIKQSEILQLRKPWSFCS